MSILDTGRGFKSNPYKIYTENDLFELSSYSGISTENVHYQLQNDITLTRDWSPLGTTTTPFKGVFDGNGFTISNVNIKGSVSRLGFFGMIESATVKSLNVNGITITATAGLQHGGLVGFANKSTINDVSVKDVNMTLPASASYVGGLMGKAGNGANITDTVFINNVSVENVTIRNGQDYLAGFIGDISSANISNSISLGDIYIYPSRTFTPSRNFSFGWVRNSSYLTINGVIMSRDGASVGALGGMTSDYSINANINRISNPRVLADYSGIWEFGGENPWDMVDGQLPKQTYFGTHLNPVPIASYSDIQTKMMNPDYKYGLTGSFKLVDDISFPRIFIPKQTVTGKIFTLTAQSPTNPSDNPIFKGCLDGNGFSFKNIDIRNSDVGLGSNFSVGLFYQLEDAEVKNLKLHYLWIEGSGNRGSFYLTSVNSIRSIINNVNIVVDRGVNLSTSFALPSNPEYSEFSNIIVDYKNVTIYHRDNLTFVTLFYNHPYLDPIDRSPILNNIITIVRTTPSYYPVAININGGNSTIESKITNIVYHVNGRTGSPYLARNIGSIDSIISGTASMFNPFKESGWIFDRVNLPIQSVFVKIVEKIEERIIQSYSKISSILLDKFKGKTLISELFTQPIMSKVKRFKGFIQTLTSYSDKSTLETIRKKKSLKVNINFSETMTFDLSRFKSRLSEIKNYSTKLMSNVKNIKKGKKSSNGYTKPLVSSSNTIKRLIKNMKSFTKKIDSKSSLYVIKKYLIKINSFGKKVISSANPSFLTRAYRTIASYSGNMRSTVRKYSNIYKFGKAVVSNSVGKISNQTKRFARIKKMAKSYSKKIFNQSKLSYKVASPVEVYAYLTAKFNKITLFKRKNKTSMNIKESKTIIKQKNNGGGD